MSAKMPQQGDLPERPPGEDDLVKHPSDAFDRDGLAGETVLDRDDEAVGALSEWSHQAPP